MRQNLPVTQREYAIEDGATLMSTTDPQSHVIYANDAFVEASGFSREEIVGQPHNLVRHPDMPPEAFADMWATLKAGEPWTGLVKNRRQNGDHYWVRANATPIRRDGRTTGYMSVRTKPTREEVAAAEGLYAKVRAGEAGGLRFRKGLVSRGGWQAWRSALQTWSVQTRIRTALGVSAVAIAGVAWFAGLRGAGWAGFTGGTVATLLAASWWLRGQISRPLEQMREQALRIATGDVKQAVQMDRVDEIGMTMRALGQVGLMFRWIVDDVSSQVYNAKSATAEIAQGTQELSARTEQAASSVEQTASSMEQMTATVQNNADTSRQAADLSTEARAAAARGGRSVGEVVGTMNEITQSSRRIADIIGTIDGIAFQTNILALNAAVEAARAGEQGRGFAVVASEVRGLAHRSAEAAKEIKQLIGESVERVEAGTRVVDGAGRTMEEIVAQVARVSDLIAEISTATSEQSAGIGQVAGAIGHLDQITQQNAALVEESSAASDSLRRQMAQLAEAVGVFR